ncbi:MAG: hypothetical protein CR988_05690 [Treponema sp.]|nr:MAG: hypothetical protein CR988_05690 [Treponema sp.]
MEDKDDLFDYNRTSDPKPDFGLRYNRFERLKNAPENVQKLYDGSYTKRPGIIKGLLAVKGSGYMLMIILAMIFILGMLYFMPKNTATLHGIKFELSCKAIPEAVLANITLMPNEDFDTTKPKPVIIAFTAFDKEGNVLQTKRLETIYIGQEQSLGVSFKLFNIKKIQSDILVEEKSTGLVQGL